MAKIHFKYRGEYFIAHAQIVNLNGNINCYILSIIDEKSDQTSNLIDFKHRDALPTNIALKTAINIGLKQYINNYPIDHKESCLINNQIDLFAFESLPSLKSKSNI